ncbi:MAG: heme-binding protein [Lysobacteraceae bacterium]
MFKSYVANSPHVTRKRILILLLLMTGQLTSTAMAVEEPTFTRVLQQGDFEIRDYPELVVAEVTVPGAQKAAASSGFRLLAGYIFGGNKPLQRIAMTAPVTQSPTTGTNIAMTAPVTQTENNGGWVVQFTMPHGYTLQTLPEPDDRRVRLRAIPPARFAVLRFSGIAKPEDVSKRMAELASWATTQHLHQTGRMSLAQYNPPWTPWFMRRNEVMVPIEK